MNTHLRNLLYRSPRKNSRFLLLYTAILSLGFSSLIGCSGKQAAAGEPAAAPDTLSDSDQQAISDIEINEPIDLSDESWSILTFAYIQGLEDGNLSFDAVEWVDVPSDRAKELDIEEQALDSGFYIYNQDVLVETLPLSEDCRCTLLDWTDSYKPVDTAIEDLPAALEERKDTNIPYELTIQNQKICNIQEHYVP